LIAMRTGIHFARKRSRFSVRKAPGNRAFDRDLLSIGTAGSRALRVLPMRILRLRPATHCI